MYFLVNLLGKLNPVGIAVIIIILVIFFSSFIVNLIIRSIYLRIQNDLENRHHRKTGVFKSVLLNRIVQDYKNTNVDNFSEVNTQAIIEKCFHDILKWPIVGERFIKNTVSILVILGLLGTFIGLTLSVAELVKLLGATNSAEFINNFTSVVDSLLYAISGMGVAFTTSMFGIACSIIIMLLYIVSNPEEAHEKLMIHIEEYLDNTVSPALSRDRETEFGMMNKILRETFKEFGDKIENAVRKTVETFGDRLSHVVMDVHISSKALDGTVEKFDNSLRNFAADIRDFSEFNLNLKNNIERMDVSFIKVVEALTDTSKIIADNYNVIESFSKDIKSAADDMTMYNRQVVQDIGNLVEEVKITVSTVKELGEAIRIDMSARTQDIQQYQERFNSLMSRLSEEINLLGRQTSEAFSLSLAENGRVVTQKVIESIQDVMKEILTMLDVFKENEKILAKTIAMLPDQALTYNEAAAAKMVRQLDEIKELFRK